MCSSLLTATTGPAGLFLLAAGPGPLLQNRQTLEGRILSTDALHTQHAFCTQVTHTGGFYLLIAKELTSNDDCYQPRPVIIAGRLSPFAALRACLDGRTDPSLRSG
jgi:hypothetical protein